MKSESRYPPSSSPSIGVPSLLEQAWRLAPFTPPFAFGAFFSPEDTLLCVCAADAARHLMASADVDNGFPIAELTSGSGLVGLYLLGRDCRARLLGLDIEAEAARVAERNAQLLGLSDRARFAQADLWSASTLQLLQTEAPRLLVCNPPYVPEPPGTRMQIEAGAGPHGTAHILRALELTRLLKPDTLALSWCSLSDPAGIIAAAEGSGYQLRTLYVTAIADGEYSGSVHSYLRSLDNCFINEQPETLEVIAPDGSARFSYLLMAGAFERVADRHPSVAPSVERISLDFDRNGVRSLASASGPFALHCSFLTRWDELELRVMLHGDAVRSEQEPT